MLLVVLGGKGENREVVVATEDFVSAMPEHLSFNEVCECSMHCNPVDSAVVRWRWKVLASARFSYAGRLY